MLRKLVARGSRNPYDAAVLCAAITIIAAGTALINEATIGTLLRADAERAAGNMSQFLADNLPDLDKLMQGGKLSERSSELLEFERAAAGVERYEVYDSKGRRVLEFKHRGQKQEEQGAENENLSEHQPQVFKQILAGSPYSESFNGEQDGKPVFVSAGYAPIRNDGALGGIIEVYLDQTARKANFESVVRSSSLAIVGILLLGLIVPVRLYRQRMQEKEMAEERVRYLAQYDDLTGLLNRASLQDRLLTSLEEAKKDESAHAALLFIDVDRFKDVNDTYGHAGGDAVLKSVGERLGLIIGQTGYIGRFGGDEFAVVMPRVNGRQSLEAFAAELIASMAKPYPTLDHDVIAPVSVGISMIPDDAGSAELALRHADLATYAAKMAGRNGFRFYEPSLEEQYARRIAVERAVRRACAAAAFEIEYQPQYALEGPTLLGFEALLRLKDSDIGSVSPAEFIPFAEDMGLILQIGEWVLREACQFAALWPAPLTIAVNLSPLQFRDGSLPKLVAAILKESGLAPNRLELEVTEGLILANTEEVMNQIRTIRASGVRFAMDDFGTKYSSLSYLWNFTFDKIKIDRDFMGSLSSTDKAAQSLETIIALGRALNLSITAEGVESAEQAKFLTDHHCDSVQGFLFGRPMPSTDVPAVIIKDFEDRRLSRDDAARERKRQVA
jgi:diguanylate cyclase (GGDEF)-like protein